MTRTTYGEVYLAESLSQRRCRPDESAFLPLRQRKQFLRCECTLTDASGELKNRTDLILRRSDVLWRAVESELLGGGNAVKVGLEIPHARAKVTERVDAWTID